MTCGDGEVMNKQPGTMRALFLTFLKIGAFTFGGGYAMIPLIQKEVVERRKWMTDGDIQGVTLLAPCLLWKGVVDVSVVTYDELFQLIIIFISFAGLIYQITKKK